MDPEPVRHRLEGALRAGSVGTLETPQTVHVNRTNNEVTVDAVFVPEWNPDADTFAALVESSALDIHAYIMPRSSLRYSMLVSSLQMRMPNRKPPWFKIGFHSSRAIGSSRRPAVLQRSASSWRAGRHLSWQ